MERRENHDACFHTAFDFRSGIAVRSGLSLPGFVGGESKADLELKRLAERIAKATVTVDQLRQEINTFRQAYPGTPQTVTACGLLRDLPSPLDKYDPKNINPLDKFDWQPKELVAVLGEHRGRQGGAVTSVVYSRNGKMLVSGSNNGYVRFWDPATMRQQHRLVQPGGNLALAFSKDNTLLAGASAAGSVILWDVAVAPPKEKESFKVSSSAIYSMALAPSGKLLAVGTGDPRVSLWDLAESPPREIATGNAHTGIVHGVAFAPDGKTLATGSADKTLRLWTILKDNKLKEKAVSEAHPGGVLAVAYHPTDEKVLATGGADGTIGIWNVGGPKPVPKNVFKSGGGAVTCRGLFPERQNPGHRPWRRHLPHLERRHGCSGKIPPGRPYQCRRRSRFFFRRQYPRHRQPRLDGAAMARGRRRQGSRQDCPQRTSGRAMFIA